MSTHTSRRTVYDGFTSGTGHIGLYIFRRENTVLSGPAENMEEYYRILFSLLQREKILSYSGRENRITQRRENTVFSHSVLVLFSTSPFNGMSPKDLGVLFALSKWHRQMRQAAEVQRQATQWQQEG